MNSASSIRATHARRESSANPADPLPEMLRAAAYSKARGGENRVPAGCPRSPRNLLAGLSLNPGRAGGPARKRVRRFSRANSRPLRARHSLVPSPGRCRLGGAVLHLERNSPLPAIVEGLAPRRPALEGAWPLPAAERAPSPAPEPCAWPPPQVALSSPARAGREAGASICTSAPTRLRPRPPPCEARWRVSTNRASAGLARHRGKPQGGRPSLRRGRPRPDGDIRPGLLARARLLSPGGWGNLLQERRWRRPRARRRLIAGALIPAILASALWVHIAAARTSARLPCGKAGGRPPARAG